ncbi:MAG TPA: hypothetical protein VGJ77_07180 [Gaiellaceae bacterium]|jgi:hypothetical protein
MSRRTLVLALAGAAVAGVVAGALAADGFKTARPAQLVPLEAGVVIDPILSTGDVVPGSGNPAQEAGQPPDNPDYQMSGIPDGLGAYPAAARGDDDESWNGVFTRGSDDEDEDDDDDDDGGRRTVEVLMNHELDGTAPAGSGARISHVSVDPRTHAVLDAWYPVNGAEGFVRFCSSTLALIDGRPLYFTGEESTTNNAITHVGNNLGRGGSSLVLDAQTGLWRETRHFGLFAKENAKPITGLARAVVLGTEDGDAVTGNRSQLYAYIAPTYKDAITGRRGSLYVWKSDSPGDGDPSTNDIHEGQTLTGRFIPMSQAENASAASLEAAAQLKSAFDFVRLEDSAISKTSRTRVYIADTGALGAQSVRGRLYQLDFNRGDPRIASLTLLYDDDTRATSTDQFKLVNPDNMDTSARYVAIQEDRNSEHRDAAVEGGYGRILLYDIAAGKITRAVARVNTPAPLRPGEWESSGVINASNLLGRDWWIVDVQAHAVTAPQPGPGVPGRNPPPGTGTGEDGQLLAIKIPNSQ